MNNEQLIIFIAAAFGIAVVLLYGVWMLYAHIWLTWRNRHKQPPPAPQPYSWTYDWALDQELLDTWDRDERKLNEGELVVVFPAGSQPDWLEKWRYK